MFWLYLHHQEWIDMMMRETVSKMLETISYLWLISQEKFNQADVQNYIVLCIGFNDVVHGSALTVLSCCSFCLHLLHKDKICELLWL
jgi:hypothetical protein